MRSRYKLLAVIVSLLVLAALSARAQDPNAPDTVFVDSIHTNTSTGIVPVFFSNDELLAGLEVTIKHNQNPSLITLDSVSFVGSRVEYLVSRFLTNHPAESAFTISAFPFSEPLIPVGSGLLCRMHFSFSGALDSTLIVLDSATITNLDVEWSVTFSTDDTALDPFHPRFQRGYLYINSSICCIGNRGNVNSDPQDVVNTLDLVYLVNRIFRFGPVPACPEEADVNSDGNSGNILDLTFLVNRIFRFGPSPGPCP